MSNTSIKLIKLVSFGYANGRPQTYYGDVIASVRDMFTISKQLRDTHDGTFVELQRALMDIYANKTRYDELVSEVKSKIDQLYTMSDDDMTFYIGCEAGKHRSVAVVCLLEKDLIEYIKQENTKHASCRVELEVSHRDLNLTNEHRRNKKNMTQNRTKCRDSKSRYNDTFN